MVSPEEDGGAGGARLVRHGVEHEWPDGTARAGDPHRAKIVRHVGAAVGTVHHNRASLVVGRGEQVDVLAAENLYGPVAISVGDEDPIR